MHVRFLSSGPWSWRGIVCIVFPSLRIFKPRYLKICKIGLSHGWRSQTTRWFSSTWTECCTPSMPSSTSSSAKVAFSLCAVWWTAAMHKWCFPPHGARDWTPCKHGNMKVSDKKCTFMIGFRSFRLSDSNKDCLTSQISKACHPLMVDTSWHLCLRTLSI